MDKDILLLYNPKAGDTFFRFELENFLTVFGKTGSTIRIFTSQFEGDMAKCIHTTHLDEIGLVVVAGGDGSVNEVIQAMMQKQDRPKLGIIPAGTRNSIARYLEMPDNYSQCIEVIYRGMTESVNVGEVNGKFFLNQCGFGSIMDIYQKTSQEMKNVFGKLAYYVNGFFRLPKDRPFQVRIEKDDTVMEEELIQFMVINSDGFRLQLADLDSDFTGERSLQLIGIRNRSKFENRKNLIRSLRKVPKMSESVLSITGDNMTVSCTVLPDENSSCFVDGEPGCEFPLHFSLHRNALDIITNRNVPRGTTSVFEEQVPDPIDPVPIVSDQKESPQQELVSEANNGDTMESEPNN